MTTNPFFGILLAIITYQIGVVLNKKTKSPIANPLLVSIILCIAVLKGFNIPLEHFNLGGNYIKFLLGPATVCLVVPLYKKLDLLKENFVAVMVGILAGTITSLATMFIFTRFLSFDDVLSASIIPKSITTAIGVDLSGEYNGLPAITAVSIVMTGVFGAVVGPSFLKATGVKDPVATGVAMGTTTHAVGTSRAMELGEVEGAMSGLCIGIAGIFTVLLMPLIMQLL